MSQSLSWIKRSGALFAFAIAAVGTVWAFTRGGADFRVFYHAWSLAMAGHGADIYRDSPDRFLYAPGFAWLFAPLALLPMSWALALWCALKLVLVGWVVYFSAKILKIDFSLAAWGVVLLVRPILIDFEYGQVNLFILAACAWPVFRSLRYSDCHDNSLSNDSSNDFGEAWDFLSWALLGIVAVGKLFPAPLLLLPLLLRRRRGVSFLGASTGVLVMLFLPVFSQGWSGLASLYPEWWGALVSRGLPLESHNQSFTAFLYHFLSGEPTEIIAQHRRQMLLGGAFFSLEQIRLLTLAWIALTASFIVSLIVSDRTPGFSRRALLIALLVVPSHLVWKPYFSMGLPLAIAIIAMLIKSPKRARWFWLSVAFAFMNLTGFDFVGLDWGARLESASLMLFAYLLLCGYCFMCDDSRLDSSGVKSRQLFPSRALGSS
jgi:hypothetical protein